MLRFFLGILCCIVITTSINATQYRPLKNDAELNAKTKKLLYGKIAQLTPEKIVIENAAGAQKTIQLDGKTKFRSANNKNLKASEFKAGAMVRVMFRVSDGKAIFVQQHQPKQFAPEN